MIGSSTEVKSKLFEQEGIYDLLIDVLNEALPELAIPDKLFIIQKIRHKYLREKT